MSYFAKIIALSQCVIHFFSYLCIRNSKVTQKDMAQEIRHDGIVDSIDGSHIRVRIVQTSACAGCKIAGHCSASEMKEKMVDVVASPVGLSVGQPVVVSTSGIVARRALLLGFALPLLLMLAVLFGMLMGGYGEERSGLAALCSLIPYYVVLWLFRQSVARNVSFGIEAR